jgi:RNA polymerase sigma factor (sigma-70 family)
MNINIDQDVPKYHQDKILQIINNIITSKAKQCVDNDHFKNPTFCRNLYDKKVDMSKTADVWNGILLKDSESTFEVNQASTKNLKFTSKEEVLSFLQYNYARHRMINLVKKAQEHQSLTKSEADSFLKWHNLSEEIRNIIVLANMGLVRKVLKSCMDKHSSTEFETISDAVEGTLYKTISAFDVSKGWKFSTYAMNAMIKERGRTIIKLMKLRESIQNTDDPEVYGEVANSGFNSDVMELRSVFKNQYAHLSMREAKILQGIYWRGEILKDVANNVGLSQERVRQVKLRAEKKIGEAMTGDSRGTIIDFLKRNKSPLCESLISTEDHLLIDDGLVGV